MAVILEAFDNVDDGVKADDHAIVAGTKLGCREW